MGPGDFPVRPRVVGRHAYQRGFGVTNLPPAFGLGAFIKPPLVVETSLFPRSDFGAPFLVSL